MFFTAVFIVGVASAARLDTTYLPPGNAGKSGGDENHLLAPTSTNNAQAPIYGDQFGVNNADLLRQVADAGQHAAPNVPNHHNGRQYAERRVAEHRFAPTAEPINVLRFNSENNGDGSYNYEFETENKISQREAGQLKNAGAQDESMSVQGSYSYVGPDGHVYTVNYVADENGFQPTGEHIHKAVEMAAAEAARSAVNGASSGGYSTREQYPNGVATSGQPTGYKY